MQRHATNAEQWKAEFIDGLPPVFTEKVRQKLQSLHDVNAIPWNNCTDGHLITVCVQVDLSICNDLKLLYK